ncbi:MAG: hypothetical protein ABIP50_02430 [Candidatus Saccharimonadales bacterium]
MTSKKNTQRITPKSLKQLSFVFLILTPVAYVVSGLLLSLVSCHFQSCGYTTFAIAAYALYICLIPLILSGVFFMVAFLVKNKSK